jgi:hypothetical protein
MFKQKISTFFLIISLLILSYVFYKSEIYWEGNKRNYYITYYLLSIALGLFSITLFFVNQIIKKYFLISVISVIFVLYLFEGYQTTKVRSNYNIIPEDKLKKIELYEKQTGKKYDTRTKAKIYKDLKKIDSNITVSYLPWANIENETEILPLSGVSNIKTIMCNENGYFAIYNSDRYGFNNPDQEWEQEEIEYLLIGDSYVQGWCVNRPNDIASVLRNLSNKSVLNLGLGGNGPLIEYAVLKEYLDLNVKKIIWFYFEGNDLINLSKELKNSILKNYLIDSKFSQNLIFNQNKVNKIAQNYIDRSIKEIEIHKPKISIKNFIKMYETRSILNKMLPENNQPNSHNGKPKLYNEFKIILKLAKDLAIKNKSEIYFVYLPHNNRFETKYNNTSYQLIKEIVENLNIIFIDFNEILEKEDNPMKYFSGHFNERGHKKIANIIYNYTQE